MSAFTERGAQAYRDSQLNAYLSDEVLAEPMGDMEIVNLLDEKGASDEILEAAVYAVRNQDFGYLVRQYERLAGPLVREEMADRVRRAEGDAAEARSEYMQEARA